MWQRKKRTWTLFGYHIRYPNCFAIQQSSSLLGQKLWYFTNASTNHRRAQQWLVQKFIQRTLLQEGDKISPLCFCLFCPQNLTVSGEWQNSSTLFLSLLSTKSLNIFNFKDFQAYSISGFCPPVKQCAESPYIEQILELRKNYDSMQNSYFCVSTSKISNQLEFTYTLNEKMNVYMEVT